MSHWSKRRKITIQLTMFTIGLVVFSSLFFYLTYERPSCFDGAQNQNERGIDCGGVCINECRIKVDEISILWARAFLVVKDTNTYVATAYLSNQNTDLYARDVGYEFEFYDKSGNLVNRATGKTAIMPFGITPVFSKFVIGKERLINQATFRFTEPINFRRVDETIPDFEITELSFSLGDKPTASGRVKNQSLLGANDFDFIVVLFDRLNNAVASSRTFIENLSSGEEKDLNFTWPNEIKLNKGDCGGVVCDLEPVRFEIHPVFAEDI